MWLWLKKLVTWLYFVYQRGKLRARIIKTAAKPDLSARDGYKVRRPGYLWQRRSHVFHLSILSLHSGLCRLWWVGGRHHDLSAKFFLHDRKCGWSSVATITIRKSVFRLSLPVRTHAESCWYHLYQPMACPESVCFRNVKEWCRIIFMAETNFYACESNNEKKTTKLFVGSYFINNRPMPECYDSQAA